MHSGKEAAVCRIFLYPCLCFSIWFTCSEWNKLSSTCSTCVVVRASRHVEEQWYHGKVIKYHQQLAGNIANHSPRGFMSRMLWQQWFDGKFTVLTLPFVISVFVALNNVYTGKATTLFGSICPQCSIRLKSFGFECCLPLLHHAALSRVHDSASCCMLKLLRLAGTDFAAPAIRQFMFGSPLCVASCMINCC